MLILFWLLFGIGLPLFFAYMALIVTETDKAVVIHFRPMTKRIIAFSEIAEVKALTYSVMRSYGGWGIRGFASNRAYNVSGNQGVELLLKDDQKVLIGSWRAEELALSIEAARG